MFLIISHVESVLYPQHERGLNPVLYPFISSTSHVEDIIQGLKHWSFFPLSC